jgi:hypothetical protein
MEITSSEVYTGLPPPVPEEKVTRVPLLRTRVGDPESKSSIELLNTEPLSDPGWFKVQFTAVDVDSETVWELYPQASPEGASFPLTKFTAR